MSEMQPWRDRAFARMSAVRDLDLPDHPPPESDGTPAHEKLFRQYVPHLREAKESAEAWWRSLVDVEAERAADDDPDASDDQRRAAAVTQVLERHPGGAVGHKFVVGAVRIHWLACDALNRKVAQAQRVAPEELVLGWLLRDRQNDLAAFIAEMPYWPIGLDEAGDWV